MPFFSASVLVPLCCGPCWNTMYGMLKSTADVFVIFRSQGFCNLSKLQIKIYSIKICWHLLSFYLTTISGIPILCQVLFPTVEDKVQCELKHGM